MTKKSHEVYIFDNEHFLALDLKESIGYGISEPPEFFTWVSAYKCQKCGQIIILSGDAGLDEKEEREMGFEYFYHGEDMLDCPQCHKEITVEVDFSEYAMGWICDESNSGVDGIAIDGLDWLARQYFNSERALREKEELEGTASMLTHQLTQLVELIKEKSMYVLMVEGKDDRAVWEQFLLRGNIPLDCVDIPVYGEGGLDEAVKMAAMFRGKKLKNIPHKLILDSDNDIKSATEKLEKKGIDKRDYCILKEKEIESYLLDEEAIARVLTVEIDELRAFNKGLKGGMGKERFEKIIAHFTGRPPDSPVKGLITRALGKIPEEIMSILEEIRSSLKKEDVSRFFPEDY